MKTYDEFSREYIEYMKANKKEVTEKQIKKVYREYKKHSNEYSVDDIILEKSYERPKINIKISKVMSDIKILRQQKKDGKNVKDILKEKLKELKELRIEKNNKR